MDTYRVNRYNITEAGHRSNRLIQGAFRYQKLNLSSPGILTLRRVGVNPRINNTPLTQLPGSFHSSDTMLNSVWAAGARTVQMTEIPLGSTPDFWEITPEGALVDSLAPQVLGSAAAAQLLNYNVEFKVKPLAGGFGFIVLADTLNSGIYITCDVTAGRITAHAGSTMLDQLLMETALPQNLSITLNKEHSVRVVVVMTEIDVTINGIPVMQLSQTSRFFGSVGLGASFGHRAVFRDLAVTSPTGDETYFKHPLTDRGFLSDFFMGTNPASVVVDGSRRDRIAYAGDLDIAGGAALASTHNVGSILGSLALLGSYQAAPGFFIPNAKIQQSPLAGDLDVNVTGLIGYSFNLLNAAASTYLHTGDVEFARLWAPKVQKMLDWADSQTLANGLFNVSDPSIGGDWNYYDPQQSGVVTKFNVVYAYALQESLRVLADGGVNTDIYTNRLEELRRAIDSQLWSDELKAYVVSEDLRMTYAQDANAIAILAGVNLDPAHSADAILSTLSAGLMTPAGPLAFSSGATAAGFQPYISPYASAYHLRAALSSGAHEEARELLETLWAPMADPRNANYTGTFWETLDAEGKPGLGLSTSLCHGWSAGPTAELTRYVLGARPTQPGWATFDVAPVTLGMTSAAGRVQTPAGTVYVQWGFDDALGGLLSIEVNAPAGTSGTVRLPRDLHVGLEDSTFAVNGEAVPSNTSLFVTGGTKFELQQSHKP